MRSWKLLCFVLFAACGLKVSLLGTSVQRPSNVALYFRIDTVTGAPVANLREGDFEIYEDGKLVSTFESRQTVLNHQVGTVHYTMLLLDLSGSVTRTGQLNTLYQVSTAFADRVTQLQQVGIYGFDGSDKLIPIAPFSSNNKEIRARLEMLKTFTPRDPSTNLYGAVEAGVNTLRAQRDSTQLPLSFGTLVVFTDGTDHAARISEKELKGILKESDLTLFAVGLGGETDKGALRNIGRDGVFFVDKPELLAQAFDEVALQIENLSRQYYLLSYCSPARAGDHELKVRVKRGRFLYGRAKFSFNAEDFSPNCDPQTTPRFEAPEDRRK